MKKILLHGYFGYGNIGDEAICASLIEELENRYRKEKCEFVIISRDPVRSIKLHSKKAIPDKIFSKKFIYELITSDKLIFCGGGRYGKYTHRRIAILALLAKLFGCKVEFRSIGFYPFEWKGYPIVKLNPKSINDKITRILVKLAFNMAEKVTVRDRFSKICLLLSGVKNSKIEIENDLALKLKPSRIEDIREIVRKYNLNEKNVYTIGLNLRTLHPKPNQDIIIFMEKIFKPLIKKYRDKVKLVFVPFGYGSSPDRFFDDDRIIAKILKDRIHNLIIIEEELKPKEILTLFNFFDLFIGVRFHSIIFAIMSRVKCIPIVYDIKVNEFLSNYCSDVILEKLYYDELGSREASKIRSIIENLVHRKYEHLHVY